MRYVDPDGRADAATFYEFAREWISLALDIAIQDSPAPGPYDILAGLLVLGACGSLLVGGVLDLYNYVSQKIQTNSEVNENSNASTESPSPLPPDKDPNDENNNENQSAKDAKKIDGNKTANKFSQDKGYNDAHDLKRSVLKDANAKDQNVSHYDIYHNSKTGETFLKHKGSGVYIQE